MPPPVFTILCLYSTQRNGAPILVGAAECYGNAENHLQDDSRKSDCQTRVIKAIGAYFGLFRSPQVSLECTCRINSIINITGKK